MEKKLKSIPKGMRREINKREEGNHSQKAQK
ncbi:Protein CBG27699 [Caenorhabditis briggsae]|uniref:Protein CBG27699 n=1 Tax=Caenorhabditis briggsae TaxID=6238 RepID=B6IJE4_CAEBR|nr:Protein CBG27699 [Caenorhabditis briggsae]CAR99978.1 Protein CBG27699 [Caenorhabditis briggsae]